MAVAAEFGGVAEQAAAEPGAVTLAFVADDLDVEAAGFDAGGAAGLRGADAGVDQVADVALEPPPKVLVERAAAREHDVLVQTAPDVDGRGLDDAVHHVRQWREEVRRVDLRVEEDLRREETFVADVDGNRSAVGVVDHMFTELFRFAVVPAELFDHIRAHVAEFFFDPLRRLEAAVGLASVSEQRLDEVGDVAAGNRNGFDRGPNHVAFGYGDDVRHAISRINDRPCQWSIGEPRWRPRGGQSQDCLHRNIQPRAVERLEHDFGRVLAVLWRIQGLEDQSAPDYCVAQAREKSPTGSVRRK